MPVFSVVLASPSRDRLYEAVSFAAAAVAQGKTALLFLRGPALAAYVEDAWSPAPDARAEKGLARFPGDSPLATLAEVRKSGKLRLYACSAWVRLLDLDAGRVTAGTDAVIGLNAFLSQAEGGPILYI